MTTATAAPLAPSKILRGTCFLWLNVGLPASGSPPGRPILHSDGTPDAITSPNAVHVGGTEAGAVINSSFDTEEEFMDQMKPAYRREPTREKASIDFTALEILDLTRLAKLMPLGTLQTQTGFKQITGGGKLIISAMTILVVAANPNAAGKFLYMMGYSAYNTAPLSIPISSQKRSSIAASFGLLGLPDRFPGDQLYSYNLDD